MFPALGDLHVVLQAVPPDDASEGSIEEVGQPQNLK